ncbi:cytochrome c oxidase subunit 3 [Pyxidicoccus xibeiensis]|uniref:cytochrome c oxidase subunit 3 n=1 Tax=Pyxidicoccus xibeiensis TaxID=2906759 RepID=UPI0020A7B95E|nr:cytochrome c oxidase subunit 3 [Pyxidicoccus xibeiensis]MCP3137252.1 cytochrome c oxidase subunit 3 [Pyxidicoccus xibeiensis]
MKSTVPVSEQQREDGAQLPEGPREEAWGRTPAPEGAQRHASDDAPGLPRHDLSAHAEGTRWLGMVLGLAAWTMFFVSLTFAVGWYRMREPWPPLPFSPLLLAAPGLFLVAGSVVLHRSRRSAPLRRLVTALVLGGGFVAMQAGLTHVAWWNHQLRIPQDGVPASAYYGLTGLHVLHVLAVLAGVFLSAVRLWRGTEVRDAVRRHAPGWHFVTAMWLLLFLAVYLP